MNKPRPQNTHIWPKVTFVGLANSHTLQVTVQTGTVLRGGQQPYRPKKGDVIAREWHANILRRDGKYVGIVVGSEKKNLFIADRVIDAPFTPEKWRQRTAVTLIYSDGKKTIDRTQPVALDIKTRPWEVTGVGEGRQDAPLEHTFFLRFANPFVQGGHYQLCVAENSIAIPSFTFDFRSCPSESIHVSQIGFRPDDPHKTAFVSCWAGTAGGLQFSEKTRFEITDVSTGKIRAVGTLKLRKPAAENEAIAAHNHVLADVFTADFSTLKTPGEYKICVESLGCSKTFSIGETVWRDAFTTAARGFYHQRRSIALCPPYTDFVRPRCFHPDDGVKIYESKTSLLDSGNGLKRDAKNNFEDLLAGKTEHIVGPHAWGGLMDAGDWDSRIQHLIVTTHLLELAELFPKFFSKLSLRIPESGNGLPDVVNEALWNLDHYRRMQLPDGGIRGGIESAEHPLPGEASWQESHPVFAYAPDPWSSFIYAGAAARASYVLTKQNKTLSAEYTLSAIRAFDWAEQHLADRKTWPEETFDARTLATAELFRTTAESRWEKLFLATSPHVGKRNRASDPYSRPSSRQNPCPTIWVKHHLLEAAWVFARTPHASARRAQKLCRSAVLAEAARRKSFSEQTAFCWSKQSGKADGWSTFSRPDALWPIRAHVLTDDDSWLATAVAICGTGAGANPLNLCFTTGVGHRFPRRPLHIDSQRTGRDCPPGITVAGPLDMPLLRTHPKAQFFHSLMRGYVTPDLMLWPVMETYWEMFLYPPITEFTVQDPMADVAYCWGYLAARNALKKSR